MDNSSEYAYWDAISALLPTTTRESVNDNARSAVEAALRLVAGAAPSQDFAGAKEWSGWRVRAGDIVEELRRGEYGPANSSHKRPRDDDASGPAKKARTGGAADANDPPLFTLHALFVTSPVRKKVDITVYASSICLTNPTSHELEHPPIPTSTIHRVFLVPTRGKSKPHWTVLILPSDTPAAAPPKGTASTSAPQIAFGLDATLTAPLATSSYANSTASLTTHPKGSPSLPALRAFLSHMPQLVLEPSTSAFRSAANGEVAGVEAYRGAKPGTLWFLDAGVLWDGKPCEFFPLDQLARGEPYEGVRTLSATGRTCTVIVRRLLKSAENGKGKGKAEADDEDDDEDDAVDIDFNMVDGKEQEPIGRWVKARRARFGQKVSAPAPDAAAPRNGQPAEDVAGDEDSDEDDETYTVNSSELGSESSSDGEDSDSVDGSGDDEDASGDESENAMDEDGGELKPENHPLLRPGAMPKMSRAAMDMVVDMVEQDLAGGQQGAESDGEDGLED